MEISLNEARKIPYINYENINGRSIPLKAFKENGEWKIFLPINDGTLVETKMIPVEADYISTVEEVEADIYLEFYDRLKTKVANNGVNTWLNKFYDDFFNIASVYSKLSMYLKEECLSSYDIRRFASTEIEYLLIQIRSMFDILQEIVRILLADVKYTSVDIKPKQLPQSFAKVVEDNGKLRTPESLVKKYPMPIEFARVYIKYGDVFLKMRKIRDSIVHHGKSADTIFINELGYAVQTSSKFSELFPLIWEGIDAKNNLIPLKPFLYFTIKSTIDAYNEILNTIMNSVNYGPRLLKDDYHIFIRGDLVKDLALFITSDLDDNWKL